MGQVLSIMGGFLPRVYAKELEVLQDEVPPMPFSKIAATFIESVGRRPEDCFRSLDSEPLAAASLGQVHTACLHDGTKVAVKILYPGIRGVIRTDMRLVRLSLRAYQAFVPVRNLDSVHASLVDLLRRETDYVHEAACMKRMAANFEDEDDVLIPEVVEELSTSEVLTMTFMEGIKITRFDELAAAGVDRSVVARRLTECFYKQLFLHRFFHADPHPGNFLIDPGSDPASAPRIVILDFGAISEVGPNMIEGSIEILSGFFEQNDALVLDGIERIGFVAEDGNRDLLRQTVKAYFQKLLKLEERTVGALMRASRRELEELRDPEVERRQLRELMRSIHYPEGWFYVERAAVLMFWLCGQIDPELDTMKVGFPYIMPLVAAHTANRARASAFVADSQV
ncbi:MAG: AarF/UbiB family protein, partial [Myxococcota bacterium]